MGALLSRDVWISELVDRSTNRDIDFFCFSVIRIGGSLGFVLVYAGLTLEGVYFLLSILVLCLFLSTFFSLSPFPYRCYCLSSHTVVFFGCNII